MDYNIYIHDLNANSNNGNFTKPWFGGEDSQTRPWKTSGEQEDEGTGDGSMKASTPNFAAFRAIKSAAKKHPIIAAAVIGVTVLKKVNDLVVKVSELQSSDTGDYRFNTWMENARATQHALFHPFSTTYNIFNANRIANNYNKRQQQERMLLGDVYVNSTTRRV